MIPAVRHLTVLLLIFPLFSMSAAVRFHQSGAAVYGHSRHARDAHARLRRRADYNSLLQERMLDTDDSYFNPNSDLDSDYYMRPMPSYLQEKRDFNLYPEYRYKKAYPEYMSREEYPAAYSGFDRRLYGPQKRTAYNPHRVVPTVEELEALFGSADVPMKRGGSMKRRVPVNAYVPEAETNKEDASDDNDVTSEKQESLVSTMRKLIDAAEKLTKDEINTVEQNTEDGPPKVVKEVIVETVSPDGEKETKLKEIIEESVASPDVSDDEENDTETEVDDDADTEHDTEPTTDEMSEVVNDNLEQAQSKSKRASSGLEESVYIAELLSKISDLKDKVSKLELLQLLEDKENDYLANALKFATLDQIDGAEEFLSKEYNDITKATETEELIQLLSEDEDEDDTNEYEEARERLAEYLGPEDDDEDMEDDDEEAIKRSNNRDQLSERWYEEPVRERVFGAELEDMPEENSDETGMAVYGGSDMPIKYTYGDDADEAEAAEQAAMDKAADEAKMEVDDEIAEENAEDNQVAILKQLLNGMSPDELQDIVAELKNRNEDVAVDDMCLAASALSENCAFADEYGIPIDDDARNLCTRHQICYTCGMGIGISKDGCDKGYTGTVIETCDGDTKCIRNAVMFLGLMAQYHNYEMYSPNQCRDPCVEDFVTGNA